MSTNKNSKYSKLYRLDSNLYNPNCAIAIKAGALFRNTENGKLHIQLKFQNLCEKTVLQLKVKILLKDSIGRVLSSTEKQYIDLRAKIGAEFGKTTAIFIKERDARQFSAYVTEVCFSDNSVQNVAETEWTSLQEPSPIGRKFYTLASLAEFKEKYCFKAKFIPTKLNDVWICACGCINKNDRDTCADCNASFSQMNDAEKETLHNDNIYKKASLLLNSDKATDVQTAYELLKSISNWKDSKNLIATAVQKLNLIEDDNKKKKRKRIKKLGAILLSALIVVCISVPIIRSIHVKNNPLTYRQVLDGYSVTAIENDSVKEIIIPDTYKDLPVISIGPDAFKNCTKLKSVTIGNKVKRINATAFDGCDSLKTIYYHGTETGWKNLLTSSKISFSDVEVYYYNQYKPSLKGKYWHYDDNGKPVVWD